MASLKTFGTLYMLSFIDLAAAVFFLLLLPETKVRVSIYIEYLGTFYSYRQLLYALLLRLPFLFTLCVFYYRVSVLKRWIRCLLNHGLRE